MTDRLAIILARPPRRGTRLQVNYRTRPLAADAARTVSCQPSEASLEWLAFSRKSSGSILCAASAVAE